MKKDILDTRIHPDLLRKYVHPGEPKLSDEEKQVMWNDILQRTHRHRIHLPKWSVAAAVAVIVIIGGWLIRNAQPMDPYLQMAGLVNVDTLHNTCLYMGQQQVELGDQVEIICHSDSRQIEIRTAGGAAFKLSAPNQNKDENTYLQLAVPTGKKAQVVLADQSRVTLRERSKLYFPLSFDNPQRKVRLEGEAYLKITHNTTKHFITETKDINVRVLGTEYLVSAYPTSNEQSVLLISGSVEIASSRGEKLVLSPNQRYVFNHKGQNPSQVLTVNPDEYMYWKEEMIEVTDKSLSDVLKQIEIIYQTNLSYDWNELEDIHISGKLDVSVPLTTLLERLTKIAPIQIDQPKKNVSLNKNPHKH